jgi:hypothetical protein
VDTRLLWKQRFGMKPYAMRAGTADGERVLFDYRFGEQVFDREILE